MIVETLACWSGGRLGYVGKCPFDQKKDQNKWVNKHRSICLKAEKKVRYMVDQNPVSLRTLRKPWVSKGPAMGLIPRKAILGWQLKAGGGPSHCCSSWWWCWLVGGLLAPSHAACGVSPGEVTHLEATGGCCMLPKWSTVCSPCGLLIKRLVVCRSVGGGL